VITRARLTVPASADTVLYERTLVRAEHVCLISNSLRCRRELQIDLVRQSASQLQAEAV
jgi:hypothetical protein